MPFRGSAKKTLSFTQMRECVEQGRFLSMETFVDVESLPDEKVPIGEIRYVTLSKREECQQKLTPLLVPGQCDLPFSLSS